MIFYSGRITFSLQQVEALNSLFIKAHEYGFGFGLVFFGIGYLIDGYLIVKSEFLPRILEIRKLLISYNFGSPRFYRRILNVPMAAYKGCECQKMEGMAGSSDIVRRKHYSVLKLFTGLATAALMAWKLMVAKAINTATTPEPAKIHQASVAL